MKKLALIIATASFATSFALGTPVFACPHDDGAAPKTAEKAKDEKGTDTKAKEQPKTTTAKKKAEPKQDTTKKPEKVSQK